MTRVSHSGVTSGRPRVPSCMESRSGCRASAWVGSEVVLDRFADGLCLAVFCRTQAHVCAGGGDLGLAHELPVAGQALCWNCSGIDGRPDGAAGLFVVRAVAKPARCGELFDVREREGDALLGTREAVS